MYHYSTLNQPKARTLGMDVSHKSILYMDYKEIGHKELACQRICFDSGSQQNLLLQYDKILLKEYSAIMKDPSILEQNEINVYLNECVNMKL